MPKFTGTKGETNTGYDKLYKGLAGGASNLVGFLLGVNKSLAGGLGLTRKGEREWTATIRVWNPRAEMWVVAFGNGTDPVEALMSLNGAIANGKFYKDKFAGTKRPAWPIQQPLSNLLPQGQDTP